MAKYIPENGNDWMKWIGTLIIGAILSGIISYYVTDFLSKSKHTEA